MQDFMKIGIIMSIYDENVRETILNVNKKCHTIVIQSDPKKVELILENDLVNFYKILPDIAGTQENYSEEISNMAKKGSTIPARALSRNFSYGFTEAKKYDADWWISIVGDVRINNLEGLTKIIEKMIKLKKSIGVTKAIGQKFIDKDGLFTRLQNSKTTDFMPQMFIVKNSYIQKGLFTNIQVTNPWTTEQCLGDEVLRFCNENSLKYDEEVYVISKYPYPKFITGLVYNPKQAHWPTYVDAVVSTLFTLKMKIMNRN